MNKFTVRFMNNRDFAKWEMLSYLNAFGPTCDGGIISNCSPTICLLGHVLRELIRDNFIIEVKGSSQVYKLTSPVSFNLLES